MGFLRILRPLAVMALSIASGLVRAQRTAHDSIASEPPVLLRIAPVPVPDPQIPGFHFPETEATVTSWITAGAFDQIALHGWGLWTALTSPTGQIYERQALRVFETWLTPQDLLAHLDASGSAELGQLPRRLRSVAQLDQLRGRPALALNDRLGGYVKFDPTAADHVLRQGLLRLSTLQVLLDGGAAQVPPFPASTLVVKPIFQIVPAASLVQGRYFELRVWEGPPGLPQAISPQQWPHAIWVDLFGGGADSGEIDTEPTSDGRSRTDATTYPLNSFLFFRLSAADAAGFDADRPGINAAAGDLALLVGMHVAGRETVRWTWQTFWWTPAPDTPPAPSSSLIARARPAQLNGAPRHYAMAIAYAMELPAQPVVGGQNAAPALYAYNPWIEAAFTPADLPDSEPGLDASGLAVPNNVGVQSNCMSCHARATFDPRSLATAPRFSGARYTDLADPQFAGTLQVDFLYSLPRSAQ